MKKSRSVLAVTTEDTYGRRDYFAWKSAFEIAYLKLVKFEGNYQTFIQSGKDSPEYGLSKSYTSSGTIIGVDLRRGRRRFSGNLQLPPLAWRQGERARTPERDSMPRPTTLPLRAPPTIAITPVDQDW
ncbi:hypothetical protein chiPu_0008336 [Chiloscyllium punctatum]|uniref:Uncharacterized protein n=1 Tax=Chiloscyllium punctatum TaxID=137246 RepID=A0A401SHS2_CHIPU|nr:hypothetical protein [Chiloscyllium punctatum]